MTTTKTLAKDGSGDFTSISSWVAWVQANMVSGGNLTDNIEADVKAVGLSPTATDTISGWAPGPNNYTTTLTAAPGASLADDKTKPLVYNAANGAFVDYSATQKAGLSVQVNDFFMSRLQIKGAGAYSFILTTSVAVTATEIDRCLFYMLAQNGVLFDGSGYASGNYSGGGKFTVNNSVFFSDNGSRQGAPLNHNSGAWLIANNCVLARAGTTSSPAIASDSNGYSTTTVTNCVFINYPYEIGTGNHGNLAFYTGSNNATTNATWGSSSYAGVNVQTSLNVATEFVGGTTSGDMRIAATSTQLRKNGVQNYLTPANDFYGTPRPQGVAPTIGAFEYAEAALGSPTVLSPANAFPGAAFPQHGSGLTAPTSSIYPGAVQPKGKSATVLSYANAFPNGFFPQHGLSADAAVQNFAYPGAVAPSQTAPGSGVTHTLTLVALAGSMVLMSTHRSFWRALLVSSSSLAVVRRVIAANKFANSNSTAKTARHLSLKIHATSASHPAIIYGKAFLRVLNAAAAHAARLVRQTRRPLHVTAASHVALSRVLSLHRTLAAHALSTAKTLRHIARRIPAMAHSTANIVYGKASLRTLSALAASHAIMNRSLAKVAHATSSGLAHLGLRHVTLALHAVAAHTTKTVRHVAVKIHAATTAHTAIVYGKAYLRSLATLASSAAHLTTHHAQSVVLAAISLSTARSKRAIGFHLTAASASIASIRRAAQLTLTKAVASSHAATVHGKATGRTLTTTAVVTARFGSLTVGRVLRAVSPILSIFSFLPHIFHATRGSVVVSDSLAMGVTVSDSKLGGVTLSDSE